MEINASHFKTMEELIRHINMCVREEDIFALERYVGLNELDILVKEIARLNKIIDDLREYMLDIDYKMGWQYAEYLDELLGTKSNYKKYGIAIDLKEEGNKDE